MSSLARHIPISDAPDREVLITRLFDTALTLRQNVLESVAKRTGAYPGWLQMLDRLDVRLGT